MKGLELLYKIGNKDIDIEKDLDLIINISIQDSIELKSLIIFKLKQKLNKILKNNNHQIKIIIDILYLITESTELNNKSQYIFQGILQIMDLILNKTPNKTIEYYKIIILLIKIIKQKKHTDEILIKIISKLESKEKEMIIKYILSIKPSALNNISDENFNIILSNILDTEEKELEKSYSIILFNLPYIYQKINFENIRKLIFILNNQRKKIKSPRLRNIFIKTIVEYFDKKDFFHILENYKKSYTDFSNNIFLKQLIVKRLSKEIEKDPNLLEKEEVIWILSKLSLDKYSLIRKIIYTNLLFPPFIRLNSFNTRKYLLQKSKNLVNNFKKEH